MAKCIIVNLDRREYITPAKFGHTNLLIDFSSAGDGVMFGLAALIAETSDLGDNQLFSAWSGNRIVIAAETSTNENYTPLNYPNLYFYATSKDSSYEDISDDIIDALVANKTRWA